LDSAEKSRVSSSEKKPSILRGWNFQAWAQKSRYQEKSFPPVLASTKVKGQRKGFDLAREDVGIRGLGHTAAIICKEQAMADAFWPIKSKGFACRLASPSTFGGLRQSVYNSFLRDLLPWAGLLYGQQLRRWQRASGGELTLFKYQESRKGRNTHGKWFKVSAEDLFRAQFDQYLPELQRGGQKSFIHASPTHSDGAKAGLLDTRSSMKLSIRAEKTR